jgi:hypothetical protein
MRGPQECRRSVLGSGIHVGTLGEELAHTLRILIFHGVGEPKILVGGGDAGHCEEGQGERQHDTGSGAPFWHMDPYM